MGTSRFEPTKLKDWIVVLRANEVILDVGANIGLTAHRFYGLLRGQCVIWCFEPMPRNLQLLQKNCECIRDRINIVGAAVGEQTAEVFFQDNLEHGALSRLASLGAGRSGKSSLWQKAATIAVKQVSLDDFINSHSEVSPTFIKIDVEGAAGLVLSGGGKLLERFRPMIDCSFHSEEERRAVCSVLTNLGYRGFTVDRNGRCAWTENRNAALFLHPADARASIHKLA